MTRKIYKKKHKIYLRSNLFALSTIKYQQLHW